MTGRSGPGASPGEKGETRNRIALVTGAGSGIGKAIATALLGKVIVWRSAGAVASRWRRSPRLCCTDRLVGPLVLRGGVA
jgi:NAD(P)-dependent dehydrogenase (short-subunit alcohol dehydrogenase family)